MVKSALFFLISAFTFSGCLITKTQLEIKAKLDELDARLSIVEDKKVDKEELKSAIDEIRKLLADISARQDEIEKKLSVLKGAKEVEKGFEILSKEVDVKIKENVENVEKALKANQEKLRQELTALREDLAKLQSAYSTFDIILSDPQHAYDEAKRIWREGGDRKRAYLIFSRIASIHRGSHLEDDCYYLMGKIKMQEGDCVTAIKNFGKVIKKFPESWLAPKAYLSTAECLKKMGERKKAKVMLEGLMRKYPSSKEARSAKEMLKKL